MSVAPGPGEAHAAPHAPEAPPHEASPGEDPWRAAWRAALNRRLARAAARLAGPLDAEAVRALRGDMKRARALLRLDPGRASPLAREIAAVTRDARRALGAPRDREMAAALAPRLAPEVARATANRLARALAAAPPAGEGASFDPAALAARLAGLAAALDGAPALGPGGARDLARGAARSYARMRRRLARARATGLDEDLHAARSAVIDHRYQLALIEPAWPGLIGPWAREAQALRRALGEHQDLAVLAAEARGSGALGLRALASVERACARRKADLATEALALGARLTAERPDALRRRLRAYLEAGSLAPREEAGTAPAAKPRAREAARPRGRGPTASPARRPPR